MKEQFIEKRFTKISQALLDLAGSILDDYETQGYDLSLRQLYYQMVSKNVIPNSEREYKRLGSLINDARLAGLIDWDLIKDRGREMIQNSHWDNPKDILNQVARQFQIDKWETQENYVEVMVEKQALEGVLEPVCRGLDIPFTANKGYSSASAFYEASKRFLQRARAGKNLYIIYLGDHDPSGIDMTRDVAERLNLFVGRTSVEQVTDDTFEVQAHDGISVNRVALNMNQVEDLNPPENPAKLTDSRANDYIRKFGNSSWELDAIEPRQLAKLVRDKVQSLRDPKIWNKALAIENKMKAELKSFADNSKFNN